MLPTHRIKSLLKSEGVTVYCTKVKCKDPFFNVTVPYKDTWHEEKTTMIPNWIRKIAVLVNYGLEELPEGVRNPDNISYGNTAPNRLALRESQLERFFDLVNKYQAKMIIVHFMVDLW